MPARLIILPGTAKSFYCDDRDRCVHKVDLAGDGLAATSITPLILGRQHLAIRQHS
jgi:hypothetical protein